MAFGLSFGKKKTRTNETVTVNRNELTNQNQSGTTASSGVTQSNTSSTGSSQTSGQQTTNQTGTSASTGTQQGSSTQRTSSFSDSTLGAIERAVGELFSTTGSKPTVSTFDPVAFVADGVASAQADVNAELETGVNGLMQGIGSSSQNNTMAAMAANRMQNDAAAKMAGVKSNLTGEAERINRENQLASGQLQAIDQGFLGSLLQALKGGVTTTTGTESVATTQNQQTANSGTTNTSESTQQQQQQQQVQTQQLLEMMTQLLQGNTATTGTENRRGTTSSTGGGFSAGF